MSFLVSGRSFSFWVWVSYRLWIIKSGNELFLAKKGRTHQWSFCAWKWKRWLHFEMSKKSNKWKNGKQSISLRKATLPRRSTDVITISARNIGATTATWPRRVLWVRSVVYARQASTKRRNRGNRMVMTYNDVGKNPKRPKRPQIGVLLNKRATKHAPFLLYKWIDPRIAGRHFEPV